MWNVACCFWTTIFSVTWAWWITFLRWTTTIYSSCFDLWGLHDVYLRNLIYLFLHFFILHFVTHIYFSHSWSITRRLTQYTSSVYRILCVSPINLIITDELIWEVSTLTSLPLDFTGIQFCNFWSFSHWLKFIFKLLQEFWVICFWWQVFRRLVSQSILLQSLSNFLIT